MSVTPPTPPARSGGTAPAARLMRAAGVVAGLTGLSVAPAGCFQVLRLTAPEIKTEHALPIGIAGDALPALAMSRLVVAVAPTDDDGALPHFWVFWGFIVLADLAMLVAHL